MAWNLAELSDYVPFTTLWDNFAIADGFGANAVRGTFYRAFNKWKRDYKYLTKLSLVLGHKIRQHYRNPPALKHAYVELYAVADAYACNHLHDEEAAYCFRVTD